MTGRDPIHCKIVAFIDSEPEWACPALLRFIERFRDGDQGDASAVQWCDERAAAEAVHLAKTA